MQRMPVGLAKELVSSSNGSGSNSGGLGALVSGLAGAASFGGSKDSAGCAGGG